MKKININQTIYEIIRNYPEVKEIMKSLGFEQIVDPIMINTAGRIMTIKKGSKMKNIDINLIKNKFKEYDFILEDTNE